MVDVNPDAVAGCGNHATLAVAFYSCQPCIRITLHFNNLEWGPGKPQWASRRPGKGRRRSRRGSRCSLAGSTISSRARMKRRPLLPRWGIPGDHSTRLLKWFEHEEVIVCQDYRVILVVLQQGWVKLGPESSRSGGQLL